MIINLPFPARELHPNARVHWKLKSHYAKLARYDGFWATKEAGIKVSGGNPVRITIEFLPPNNRPRDLDGCFSSMKNAYDGIADALGINDRLFLFTIKPFGKPVKNGKVLIEVTEIFELIDKEIT